MAVHQVVAVLFCERLAGTEHVLVHLLDPGDEATQLARPARLAHAVHRHAGQLLHAPLSGL